MEIVLALISFVLIDAVFVWTAISIAMPLAVYRDPRFIGGFTAVFIGLAFGLQASDNVVYPLVAFNIIASLMHVVYLRANSSGRIAFAVLKRNFIGYFSNPSGYVFLCLFVLLTSLAAFWPPNFFINNLANLDQLNQYLPMVMLIFIPAITMGIWSEESRQGTDELLLTLPANDFDIVVGKYLATGGVFTASLLFSQLANSAVLAGLTNGNLDAGLLSTTYLGYWLMGMAMLSLGMVASFLTSNLTVGFILGVVFNAPLVFISYIDTLTPASQVATARTIASFSMSAKADDLGRGVVSSSSMVYFLLVISIGLYLSMILIGKRHWSAGQAGKGMGLHFLVRSVALVLTMFGLSHLVTNQDWFRKDLSEGKISTISNDTKNLIRNLEIDDIVRIDAFISSTVPEIYVKTRTDLLSMLKEFDRLQGGSIEVNIYQDIEPFSDEATIAKERYGIEPTIVNVRTRGRFEQTEVIMGAAFRCKLDKVVIPFFDYGVPVEYELARSIATVTKAKRKKLAVVKTDASMFGSFDMQRMQQIPKQLIVQELEKQYDVEEIDPTAPIDIGDVDNRKYDAMMVVQPSSLGPPELDNVITAIKNGMPTAIFEDPRPMLMPGTPTGQAKRRPQNPMMGGMGGMGGGGGPIPKGDIRKLWKVLDNEVPGANGLDGLYQPHLVFHEYNPYPRIDQTQQWNDLWVIIRNEAIGAEEAFSTESSITNGIAELLFILPGGITNDDSVKSKLTFTPLVTTGAQAGSIASQDYEDAERQMQQTPQYLGNLLKEIQQVNSKGKGAQILAARIQGEITEDELMADEEDGSTSATDAIATPAPADEPGAEQTPSKQEIDVIYVADIDVMSPAFLRIRAQPDQTGEFNWQFENVTFMLNVIDQLSGDDGYVEIRKRKTRHHTLSLIENVRQEARANEQQARGEFKQQFDKKLQEAEASNQKQIDEFRTKVEGLEARYRNGEDVYEEYQSESQQFSIVQENLRRRLEVQREKEQRDMNKSIEVSRRNSDTQVRQIQNSVKYMTLLAAIPPILVGFVVFVSRSLREREGVAKSRLK